jgi:hypothetical protein
MAVIHGERRRPMDVRAEELIVERDNDIIREIQRWKSIVVAVFLLVSAGMGLTAALIIEGGGLLRLIQVETRVSVVHADPSSNITNSTPQEGSVKAEAARNKTPSSRKNCVGSKLPCSGVRNRAMRFLSHPAAGRGQTCCPSSR